MMTIVRQEDFEGIIDLPEERKPPTLQDFDEMEARLEKYWMAELRNVQSTATENANKVLAELATWRTIISMSFKLDHALFHELSSAISQAWETSDEEERKTLIEPLTERLVTYLQMGQDFETLMTAVKSSEALTNIWDMLLVTMKLGGHDEPLEE